jgi:hypothetical protein
MRYISLQIVACAIVGTALLTACGNSEDGALVGAAVQPSPTDSGWVESWTHQVEQNPAQDIGAEDLSGSAYQELLKDWRTTPSARPGQTPEQTLAEQFRQAEPDDQPLRWFTFSGTDLYTFAQDTCYKDGPQAAQLLVSKLPGLSIRHAALVDQAMQLIPRHCKVLNPDAVDATSNVFFRTMANNAQAQGRPSAPSTAPAPTPSSTENQQHYRAVCGAGSALGGYFVGRLNSGFAKAFGVVAIAAASVYCPDQLKPLFQ